MRNYGLIHLSSKNVFNFCVNTVLKRFLLYYLLQFLNGLFIVDFVVVSSIRLSFHRTYRTFYSDWLVKVYTFGHFKLCSLLN